MAAMYPSHLQTLYTQAILDARSRYDPQHALVASGPLGEGAGKSFRPAASLPYAQALLGEGDPESIQTACQILMAVLKSQERDPEKPHVGNFIWLAGDTEVTDLNAVQFVLRNLLPLLVTYDRMLPIDLLDACHQSVHLALIEEERLDVAPTYTNIHLMSLFSLIIGGQWLKDSHFLEVGHKRWSAFARYTLKSGAPHEYNSTNYCAVDLSTLAALYKLVGDKKIQLQTHLLYERFWLHIGLHFHRPTSQFSGPQARSYWLPMTTGKSMMANLLWRQTGWKELLAIEKDGDQLPIESLYGLELLLTEHKTPFYLLPWLDNQEKAMPYEVFEMADAASGDDLTTYLTRSYAMGTSSKTYSIGTNCYYIEHQANYLMLHYLRPNQIVNWGMVYSRFVVNDRHWGTKGAAPDRPKTANFYELGHFAGAQYRNKAIIVYALMPEDEEIFSLKTVVVFQAGEMLEKIWVNNNLIRLGDVPFELTWNDWLIVEDGAVYVGVKPLEPTCLGPGFGVKIERGPLGEVWLSIYNYHGNPKRFWEYASLGGAFWKGNIKAGFIIEVAERIEYLTAALFLEHLQNGKISDNVNDHSIRSVSYESGGDHVRLDYDLWHTQPTGRWLNGYRFKAVGLRSPLAIQGDHGTLVAGNAKLETNNQPMWLVAEELLPEQRAWIATNPQDIPTKLHFETPCGVISADEWRLGRITWLAPEGGRQAIQIEGVELPKGLIVPEEIEVAFSSPDGIL